MGFSACKFLTSLRYRQSIWANHTYHDGGHLCKIKRTNRLWRINSDQIHHQKVLQLSCNQEKDIRCIKVGHHSSFQGWRLSHPGPAPYFSQISGPSARGDSSLAALFTCNLRLEKFLEFPCYSFGSFGLILCFSNDDKCKQHRKYSESVLCVLYVSQLEIASI